MRTPVTAVVAALLAATLGAIILGEYELAGIRPLLAGLLFGVAVAEIIASLARSGVDEPELMAASALVAEAGLVWATWISTGRELDLAGGSAWAGILVGTLAAPLWLKSAGRRGERSRIEPGPSPGG